MFLPVHHAIATRCCGPDGCGRVDENGALGSGRYCIADDCMAWRWRHTAQLVKVMQSTPETSKDGYCGYAGIPLVSR